MERWKVMLADDNRAFLDLLAARINEEPEFEIVCTALDGEAALEGITQCSPDVLVLDIIMPKLDGIAVQEKLKEMPKKPRIIIFSALGMDNITRQSLELGADAYFIKPFSLDVFIRRFKTLMGESKERQLIRTRQLMAEDLDRSISQQLHMLAIAPHLKGYKYLKLAIHAVINDKGMLDSITYKIYPLVAKAFDTTPTRVERAIRSCIENAWDRCRVETIEKVFGYSLDERKGKPSNSELIAMVADRVLLDMHSIN